MDLFTHRDLGPVSQIHSMHLHYEIENFLIQISELGKKVYRISVQIKSCQLVLLLKKINNLYYALHENIEIIFLCLYVMEES